MKWEEKKNVRVWVNKICLKEKMSLQWGLKIFKLNNFQIFFMFIKFIFIIKFGNDKNKI